MKHTVRQVFVVLAVAAGCNLAPTLAQAVLPLMAGLGKQILQNMIFGGVKTQLIGSLAQQGCKGAALVSLFSQAEQTALFKHGPPALGGAKMTPAGGTSMPSPAGMTMPSPAAGMTMPSPAGMAMPSPDGMTSGSPGSRTIVARGGAAGGGFLGGMMDKLRSGLGGSTAPPPADAAAPADAGAAASPAEPKPPDQGKRLAAPVLGKSGPDMTEALQRVQEQRTHFVGAAGQPATTPEQMQSAAALMGQMQDAMAHPLTRAETLGVFDELHGMGMLTDAMHAEARDCILLAPPSASQAIGGTGAMFKTMLLPRGRLATLPPDQQQQLADELSQALREAKPSDRKAFREGLGKGFLPPPVLERVRAGGALD
jgi:hypothetical protein